MAWFIQCKDNDQNKGATMYIDGRPKAVGNIAGFINSTQPSTTNKKPNCILEGSEGNYVFVCAIKSIAVGEGLLIDYNLNRIDNNVAIMGAVCILFYPTRKQCLLLKCSSFDFVITFYINLHWLNFPSYVNFPLLYNFTLAKLR